LPGEQNTIDMASLEELDRTDRRILQQLQADGASPT
jgi:DNA-binding Lrp family transcriptional regulator